MYIPNQFIIQTKFKKNNNDYNNALKILSTSLNDNDSISNPSKIFSKSITQYKEEFDDYIDITALNVIDKTEVSLLEFDINYKAPSFQEIMYKYQVNLESCLDSSHLLKYENFRKQDYSFDRYVALNSTKYSSLNVNTKYNHIVAGSLSDGISGLTLILQNAGLGAVAIEALCWSGYYFNFSSFNILDSCNWRRSCNCSSSGCINWINGNYCSKLRQYQKFNGRY